MELDDWKRINKSMNKTEKHFMKKKNQWGILFTYSFFDSKDQRWKLNSKIVIFIVHVTSHFQNITQDSCCLSSYKLAFCAFPEKRGAAVAAVGAWKFWVCNYFSV